MRPILPLRNPQLSPGVLRDVHPVDALKALFAHVTGEWGHLPPMERARNLVAVKSGKQVTTLFRDRFGTEFLVETSADRSATRMRLPEEKTG